jgi:hypothetical protein
VDDPQRQPRDRDRSELVARIKHAADEGRIGSADRDIRLGNVASASSMAELDLMSRELDQLEATLAPGSTPTPPPQPGPGSVAASSSPLDAAAITDQAVDVAESTARSLLPVVGMAAVILVLGAVAAGVLAFRDNNNSSGPTIELQDPLPFTPGATDDVSDPVSPTPSAASGTAYSLTGPGVRAFLRLYRQRFETSQVVDLTLYGDYVIVQVPVVGKARHAGWLYRPDSGFTSFGGVTANFPGAKPVDTDQLAIPALIRNIAVARSTLKVEDPNQTYVIVRFFSTSDEAPSVDIHVANEFNESGYLATTLDGTVEQAYPFGQ